MMSPTMSFAVDPRWRAVVERRGVPDHDFVYAVRTTGVFCRPTCPSRRPRFENVEFFGSTHEAERAGYRPCRRCKPLERPAAPDPIARAYQLVRSAEQSPTLAQLASAVALSPSHLQRGFKARYGMSPRELAAQGRIHRLRGALRAHQSVARATYDAGYGSSSRVYESADRMLGMTPAEYARGGAGQTIRYATVRSLFGPLLVGVTSRGVCAVLLGPSDTALTKQLAQEFPAATIERVDSGADDYLQQLVDRVATAVASRRPDPTVPLDLSGTEFQVRVWKALLTIPPGRTTTYTAVARNIGQPEAVRAVANAIGCNRLAIVVPCHRVVRQDGSMGGYRWGVPLKRQLLDAERETS